MNNKPDATAFRKQVDEQSAQWVTAFNNRDSKACAALYTEDVVALYPRMAPVRGRAELAAAYQAPMDSGVTFKGITTEACECDGRIGYAIQTAHSNRGDMPALLTFRMNDTGDWLACCEAVFPDLPTT